MIRLFNSFSGEKEDFNKPLSEVVKLYVCGLTVYDQAHVGHLRCLMTFDLLVRYLRKVGYEVMYVRNITDVDDKIIKRSKALGVTWQNLVEGVIKSIEEEEEKSS